MAFSRLPDNFEEALAEVKSWRASHWNAKTVLAEDAIQRMAAELKAANEWIKKSEKIIADQDALLERQTARIVDLQTHIENLDGEDR
tara:strand:- start:1279 stop:1539 length:261 start_codon:yes stop_codon:yes gene_type:complete